MSPEPVYEPFLPADDYLHGHDSHPWATETWWFCFFIPERGLGGWLYALVRPNQRISAGGLWIWDATGSEPRTSRYFAHYTALPTRLERLAETPVQFPSSFRVDVEAPGMVYGLQFADEAADLRLDLTFAATMPAIGHKASTPPFYASAHYDQAGHVTGTLQLDGESLEVDCFAIRDRSWGLRSERVVPNFSYCWLANAEEMFLVYAPRVPGTLEISRGILHRDGVTRPIVSGLREESRDPANGWVTELAITAQDDLGRRIEASASSVSRLVHPRPTSANTISLLDWSFAGQQAWGEDQDVWPHQMWKQWMRQGDRSPAGGPG